MKNCKNTARLLALAFVLIPAGLAHAQQNAGGIFYYTCGPAGGPAVTLESDNHMRITIDQSTLIADDAYRTDTQVYEGELTSMRAELCEAGMKNCKSVEGIFTAYKDDGETIEGAIEYFDGTETQGDAESMQGKIVYLKVTRDKDRPLPPCFGK